MSNEIGLGEFIAKVKEDLKPMEGTPIFFLEKVELEIHVTVSQESSLEGQAKGKVDLKINVLGVDLLKLGEGELTGKSSGKSQRQDIHTIKVALVPILTREEMVSSLNKEDSIKIKEGITKKIMRGETEEPQPSLGKGESKNKAATRKTMRG
ncbi:trypco2 family protein [Stenomitos frigidus]|uniref:Trypsin-co-occurring domain-containing protein n=1 Tax=Stenomitos frigidus ULC18 TaxID=2107698 RepID=A0A2T1EFR6_9CYAN|nr:trypco2 family protein [Stenomitos frigidus]PSB31596.1 hypothetical protein C7B82_07165 [Stenomitos frigidus ULC18]